MSETKWTTGPWLVNSAGFGSRVGDFEVAEFYVYNPNLAKNVAIASDILDPTTAEPSEANAHLIAAAPDFAEGATEFELYEQAVAREDDVAAMQHYAKAAETLRNALAKARGEQP